MNEDGLRRLFGQDPRDEAELLKDIPRASLQRLSKYYESKGLYEALRIVELSRAATDAGVTDATFRKLMQEARVKHDTYLELQSWVGVVIEEKTDEAIARKENPNGR